MDATKTTESGGCLAQLASISLFIGTGLLTIYLFLVFLGQGSVRNLIPADAFAAAAGGGSAAIDPGVPGNVANGKALFTAQGCAACHNVALTTEGGLPCPNQGNIAIVGANRRPGMDAPTYIRESITNPSAFLVAGYQDGVMPKDYATKLNDTQIQDLVAYLMTLRK